MLMALIARLQQTLQALGIDDELNKASVLGSKPILIGGGTDGALVNVAEQNGMKGKIHRELPWLFWAWCYAHRLELACKDSFSSGLFTNISACCSIFTTFTPNHPRNLES